MVLDAESNSFSFGCELPEVSSSSSESVVGSASGVVGRAWRVLNTFAVICIVRVRSRYYCNTRKYCSVDIINYYYFENSLSLIT